MNDIISILKSSEIFKGLDEDFYRSHAHLFSSLTLEKNRSINNGDLMRYFFTIGNGAMKSCFHDPDTAKTIAPYIVTRYESFDLVCVIDNIYNASEYVALDDTFLLKVQSSFLREWMEEYPKINVNMLHALTKILRDIEHFSESLVFYDVKTRLADLILRLALKEKKRVQETIDIPYHLTHETLAQMIGSVRSVVTTALNDLKRDGAVLDRRAHIIVQNLEKLKKRIPNAF